jgi:hypothetical protein
VARGNLVPRWASSTTGDADEAQAAETVAEDDLSVAISGSIGLVRYRSLARSSGYAMTE